MDGMCVECGGDFIASPGRGGVRCVKCAERLVVDMVGNERAMVLDRKLMGANAEAWDRQVGESARAYASFMEYLMMGAERTIVKTAEVRGVSKSRMASVAKRWEWAERAKAYDDYLWRRRRVKRERELEEALDEQVEIGKEGMEKVRAAMRELEAGDIHPGQMVGMMRMFSELRLQGLGYKEGEGVEKEGGPTLNVRFVSVQQVKGEGGDGPEVVEGEFVERGVRELGAGDGDTVVLEPGGR